ncbi:LacI family DNA-binding transcriptional regulator [Verrucomicrobium sp. GAS474]|uniref:LacI family DNA-binding transcriptional regulator n=1 Tax=Verrucomicrobium sp. GAS474 TaxID=1882831 RepID=UPI00139002DA|nr:LacI family DNA-binding transcriptional regulator [Verrucomicrobium sp. GAS474]
MSSRRISQTEIARRAGVHVTTVSLALRDSPRLPAATRERIQKLAKDLGYEPDPMLAALVAYKRNARTARHQGLLAWINNHTPPEALYEPAEFREYREGTVLRCAELGYKLEEFHTATTTPAQLSRMLHARNIQGLLFPPQPVGYQNLTLDWENFSSVAFGFRLQHPAFHRACNAQYRSAMLAVETMRAKGYRRIGFVTVEGNERSANGNFSSGYLSAQRHFPRKEHLPPLIFDDTGFGPGSPTRADPGPAFQKKFAAWYEAHRPDAILSHDPSIPLFFKRLKIDFATCGLAVISTTRNAPLLAGIHQNNLTIGRAAVDFLVGMIHRNERGIPETPIEFLVEGIWVDAPSLPGR